MAELASRRNHQAQNASPSIRLRLTAYCVWFAQRSEINDLSRVKDDEVTRHQVRKPEQQARVQSKRLIDRHAFINRDSQCQDLSRFSNLRAAY
jgi:hypothetical protein